MRGKQNVKFTRESGIELLRIIMMLQVIFLHICEYGKYYTMAKELGGIHLMLYWVVWMMCRCPVYLYIAVQGYFCITKETSVTDTLKKAAKTHRIMLFYSIGIPIISLLFGNVILSKAMVGKAFFPVLSKTWYFMTNYLIVLLLSPYINKALNKISKKDYQILLVILTVLLSIWPILAGIEPLNRIFSQNKVIASIGGKGLYGFLFMYIIGGYLRLHVKKKEKARIRYLVYFIILAVVNAVLVYKLPGYKALGGRNDNPLVIIQIVLLILFFRELKFKSKVINLIASANIGVYMIHEHYIARKFVWAQFTQTKSLDFYSTMLYPFKILGICVTIYIACAIIDLLRQQLFKLPRLIKNRNSI